MTTTTVKLTITCRGITKKEIVTVESDRPIEEAKLQWYNKYIGHNFRDLKIAKGKVPRVKIRGEIV
jgi:hypothetical protein